MMIAAIDGYYDTSKRRPLSLEERPATASAEPIAVTVAIVRAVYEGCWYDRAVAFLALGTNPERLSPRQRAMTRDDPALGRHLRRIAARLHPATVAALRETWAGRCIPQRVLIRAAIVGSVADQLRAAAGAVGKRRQ